MARPRVRYYLAASLDGFIGTPDGDVSWLEPYPPESLGFSEFLAGIGTIVMGRASYEQVLDFGPWPYGDKRTVVLTSRPLRPAVAQVEAWSGDVDALIAEARGRGKGDVWILGGARAARLFLDAGLIDRLEVLVVPVLLGQGIPMFGGPPQRLDLGLVSATPRKLGVVELVYELGGQA
jgi:dihydrofolate reductase